MGAVTVVYFTTKNRANQEKDFKSLKEFNAWLKRNSNILMDYRVLGNVERAEEQTVKHRGTRKDGKE